MSDSGADDAGPLAQIVPNQLEFQLITEMPEYALSRCGLSHYFVAARSGLRLWFLAGAVLIMSVCSIEARAQGKIHRQTDPRSGITTYSFHPAPDNHRERRGVTPEPHTARLPPPVAPVAPVIPTQSRITPAPRSGSSSGREVLRVSAETQNRRDSERRQILQQELALEEKALAQAIEANAAADVVLRYRENIAALQREIHNTR